MNYMREKFGLTNVFLSQFAETHVSCGSVQARKKTCNLSSLQPTMTSLKVLICIMFLVAAISFTPGLSKRKKSKRPKFENRQKLVGYWGQNSAGNTAGNEYEDPLADVCQSTKFDILVIAFVVPLFDTRNKDELPGINLSYHCGDVPNSEYPSLLKCPDIEVDIKECQNMGKKVTISIGGATGDGTLSSPDKARELARNLFDLYLGGTGMEDLRPFGTAILDGIDLDIEGGTSGANYDVLITELRTLMDGDPSKTYLITGAPQCPYPDLYLGPGEGTGLGEAGQYVDHIYVQFYNNPPCYVGSGAGFDDTLDQWLSYSAEKGTLVFIGLPAAPGASGDPMYYLPPQQLREMYKSKRGLPGIGGMMLWDVSWDQNNIIRNNQPYSRFAHTLLRETVFPNTTEAPHPTPGPTSEGPTGTLPPTGTAAPTVTAPPTGGPVSCVGVADGTLIPDPDDCSMFVECSYEVAYYMECSEGLLFDPGWMACNYPDAFDCSALTCTMPPDITC